uniref:Ankyrin domain protein n=1 Tax=Solanum tuberosum TaxID=4113 RepID=M1C700_SOLTU
MAEKSKGFWTPAPAAAVEAVLPSPNGASMVEDSEDFLLSAAPDFSSEKKN